MKKVIITIDGPAASGKGQISKYISRKWKLKHLDSGSLYRHLAAILSDRNINISSNFAIKRALSSKINLSYKKNKKLRSEHISKIASEIAINASVRSFINEYQRDFVNKNIRKTGFVIDGRDIGSVVFKKANLKLYIKVNLVNRAKRRYKQLIDSGEKSIYPQILKDIKLRDKKDKTRSISPLVIPHDAYIIDNNSTFKETVNKINLLIKNL